MLLHRIDQSIVESNDYDGPKHLQRFGLFVGLCCLANIDCLLDNNNPSKTISTAFSKRNRTLQHYFMPVQYDFS